MDVSRETILSIFAVSRGTNAMNREMFHMKQKIFTNFPKTLAKKREMCYTMVYC